MNILPLLAAVPFLPLAAFLLLAVFGRRISRSAVTAIGSVPMGLSALLTIVMGVQFIAAPPAGGAYTQTLWRWITAGEFQPDFALRLDALSLVFTFVITFVGFLIFLYSTEFMRDDDGYPRFLAYMNLFAASMLILVLADNLLFLYLGWEGVGLCSYLLIGFWYEDPANGRAARKAFLVTRIGDTAMAIGLFLLFTEFATLSIPQLLELAPVRWVSGGSTATLAAALLLGGALGKSAQLPLQVWLPDAMAGPTPVSALIHAATMVTAGVYLIARMNALFVLSPAVMTAVAVIGAATLLVAGCAALTQRDIKRVLAYSTISQIGYMFLALGVGAWSAGIFHFMTHAFFKALLFLGAGGVIYAAHHEHDMFRLGGLRRSLPVVYWTFLIGSASLAALPLITAGFYSKDLILWQAWAGAQGDARLWAAGVVGAALTALYTFRMVFVTFHGEAQTAIERRPGKRMRTALIVLAALSLIGGLVETPHTLGHVTLFSGFLSGVLPGTVLVQESAMQELLLQLLTAALAVAGIVAAWYFYLRNTTLLARLTGGPFATGVKRFLFSGWGFDAVYDVIFVRPLVGFARVNRQDFVDLIYESIAAVTRSAHRALSTLQSGKLRHYALGILIGTIVTLTLVVLL